MSKKNWIQKAVKKPGALRKSLGVKKGQKIPAGKLKASRDDSYGRFGSKAKKSGKINK